MKSLVIKHTTKKSRYWTRPWTKSWMAIGDLRQEGTDVRMTLHLLCYYSKGESWLLEIPVLWAGILRKAREISSCFCCSLHIIWKSNISVYFENVLYRSSEMVMPLGLTWVGSWHLGKWVLTIGSHTDNFLLVMLSIVKWDLRSIWLSLLFSGRKVGLSSGDSSGWTVVPELSRAQACPKQGLSVFMWQSPTVILFCQ